MSWVRLADEFPEHPKAIAAGDEGVAMFVASLCYAARNLTDGFVPVGQVRRLTGSDAAEAVAEQLCAVRLWETAEGGYQIHDYLDYNPSRAEVLAKREADARRKRPSNEGVSNRNPSGVAAESRAPVPHPVPQIDHTSVSANGSGSSTRPRARQEKTSSKPVEATHGELGRRARASNPSARSEIRAAGDVGGWPASDYQPTRSLRDVLRSGLGQQAPPEPQRQRADLPRGPVSGLPNGPGDGGAGA